MSNLECQEFQRRFDEAVELRQPPPMELHEHADKCDACRSRWDEHLVLEEAIPRWCAAVPSVELTDSILAQLANTHSDRSNSAREIEPLVSSIFADKHAYGRGADRRHRSKVSYAAAAAAAVLLIGLFTFYSLSRPVEQQVVEVPPIQAPNLGMNTTQLTEQPEYSLIVLDASTAYLELASDAAAAISDGAALLPTANLVAEVDVDPRPNLETPSWIRKVGSNLEPIGNNLGSAIDFLLKAPPPESSPAT